MNKLILATSAILLGATAALAGASSENRLDQKSLEGPGGEGANSSDPNVERSGTQGPSGPSDAQKGKAGSQFNDYSTGGAQQPATDKNKTEGTDSLKPGSSSSGSSSGSSSMPSESPGSNSPGSNQ